MAPKPLGYICANCGNVQSIRTKACPNCGVAKKKAVFDRFTGIPVGFIFSDAKGKVIRRVPL